MGIKAIARLAPILVQFRHPLGGTDAQDVHIFVADRDYEIMDVWEFHNANGGSGCTLALGGSASGTAPASLTSALSSTFSIESTNNVPVQATLSSTLSDRVVNRGEHLSVALTGTITSYEGGLSIILKPIRNNPSY